MQETPDVVPVVSRVGDTHSLFQQYMQEGVGRILDIEKRAGDLLIFSYFGEKIGVIRYKLREMHGQIICDIDMFGTQNGIASESGFKEMGLLDLGEASGKKNGLSYAIMEQFVREVCLPNKVARIYLFADIGKKEFWKGKIGKFLLDKGLIQRMYSLGSEICFDFQKKPN